MRWFGEANVNLLTGVSVVRCYGAANGHGAELPPLSPGALVPQSSGSSVGQGRVRRTIRSWHAPVCLNAHRLCFAIVRGKFFTGGLCDASGRRISICNKGGHGTELPRFLPARAPLTSIFWQCPRSTDLGTQLSPISWQCLRSIDVGTQLSSILWQCPRGALAAPMPGRSFR